MISNVQLLNYKLYFIYIKIINQFGLNPRGAGRGKCDMGFEKWLHISGEIQPGTPPSVLTYLVETKVVNMWIYEENII